MNKCLELCDNYAQRIGNDVGWMTQLVKNGYYSLMNSATPEGIPVMLSLNTQALHASQKMQIVYLVNLFESFVQDFIAIKDNISEGDMNSNDFWKPYLREIIRKWDIYCSRTLLFNKSTSFMNIRFSLFVLKEKYGIDLPTYLVPVIPELGSLRNCLVHYDGNLTKLDKGGKTFKETLSETLKFIHHPENVLCLRNLNTNDFINKVTFDLQKFVELCGGRITR